MLEEQNKERLKEIILQQAHQNNAQNSIGKKIGDLYNIVMDSVKLNKDGITPVKELFKEVNAIKNRKEMTTLMAKFYRNGIDGLFSTYISADMKDSKTILYH